MRRVDVEFVRGERREQGEVLVERESWLSSSEIGGGGRGCRRRGCDWLGLKREAVQMVLSFP